MLVEMAPDHQRTAVHRQAATRRPADPHQVRRQPAAGRARAGPERWHADPAQGAGQRRGAGRRAAPAGQGARCAPLRPAADPLSCRGHQPGRRPDGGLRSRSAAHGDARQHGGAGADRAAEGGRPAAHRRRPGAQPARGRGARHGCRRDHCRQPGHTLAAARADRRPAGRVDADAGHPDRAERAPVAAAAAAAGRARSNRRWATFPPPISTTWSRPYPLARPRRCRLRRA